MGLRKIEPGMVVHCQTEEEARVLMEWAHKCGYEWMDGKPKEYTAFAAFEKYTCYNFHETRKISYAEKAYFEKYKKQKVIEYSDIIFPELTAKEVLDTIHEICAGHNRCDGKCSIYNACPMRVLCSKEWDSAEEIIETCRKIAAHEKKEPGKEEKCADSKAGLCWQGTFSERP